jgi:hypothetical protein
MNQDNEREQQTQRPDQGGQQGAKVVNRTADQ